MTCVTRQLLRVSQVTLFCASLQIMDTLAEIQERHDAVRDLEKKLLDLQQVNLDPIDQKHTRFFELMSFMFLV